MDEVKTQTESKREKVLNLVKNIVTWVVVAVAVFMMIFTVISATTLNRNDRSLFGLKMYKVLSDSMKATDFAAGDLVFVKEVDPATLKEGDIVSYISQNTENFGETVTHKIRRLTTDADGNAGFVTYGTTTDTDDEKIVTYPFVVGKYQFHIPKLGYFFDFLRTTPGYIVCILIPFLLLILSQGLTSVRLFRQYKSEQNAALEEEKAKIAAEKEETQKMMAELMAMKAQMEAQSAQNVQNAQSAQNAQTETPSESAISPQPEQETATETEAETASGEGQVSDSQ